MERSEDTYRKYAELLAYFYLLCAEGKRATEEADNILQQTDYLWPLLDPVQRKSLGYIGSIMNRIETIAAGKESTVPRYTPQEIHGSVS